MSSLSQEQNATAFYMGVFIVSPPFLAYLGDNMADIFLQW